jgi:hypothetical protein
MEHQMEGSGPRETRIVQRIVTTLRGSGADASVSERQVFELDVNGRLVLVFTQSEHARD